MDYSSPVNDEDSQRFAEAVPGKGYSKTVHVAGGVRSRRSLEHLISSALYGRARGGTIFTYIYGRLRAQRRYEKLNAAQSLKHKSSGSLVVVGREAVRARFPFLAVAVLFNRGTPFVHRATDWLTTNATPTFNSCLHLSLPCSCVIKGL